MIYVHREDKLIKLPGKNAQFVNSSFETIHRHLPLSATLSILACTLMIFLLTVTIQVVNIVWLYRDYRTIMATSHRLNHIVLIGFYLVLMGIVVHTLQKATVTLHKNTESVLWHLVPWSISIGLTLILGTQYLKTWRLYYIFKTKTQIVQPVQSVFYCRIQW